LEGFAMSLKAGGGALKTTGLWTLTYSVVDMMADGCGGREERVMVWMELKISFADENNAEKLSRN
jgi:hypothetical protein